MEWELRLYRDEDVRTMTDIWNGIVEAADSFPGDEPLTLKEAAAMFAMQTATVVACDGDEVVGLYILHPNNIGRCAHIANASYGVHPAYRGRGIGRLLVLDCLKRAKDSGFIGLQYNAVVKSNTAAIALYLQLGFSVLGTVKKGYRLSDGSFTDTLIFYRDLS